jgi:PhzF family phenazine biosynthesis protein
MKLPIYQVDSFTGSVFAGNPAGVVLLDRWLDDAVMLAIAAENNVSETAFVVPGEEGSFGLRWFAPRAEVDLCGHATLASAFVLFEEGIARGDEIRFEAREHTLTVRRDGGFLAMDFPAWRAQAVADPAALVEALGKEPREVLSTRDLMAVYDDESDVAALAPRFDLLEKLDWIGVVVTAPGREVDFVSRFFAPGMGVPEDPVTGSSFCTLAPYWGERLGKARLVARQISARGGEVRCEVLGDRVTIAGEAALYLRGEIEVPDAR